MTPRLTLIPPRRANAELRAAYDGVKRAMGASGPALTPLIMQSFSHRPNLMLAAAEGYRHAGWGGRLPRATRELVALLVSRENECFY
jgi:alkylhydroperoxidase family enzyme